jgi:hypothetical protein
MSVLGFDIRDYTDPQRILEESIRAPFGTVVSPQPTAAPATPAPAPSVPPATAPVTIDQGTGAVVNGPPGINPAATEQPPAVPIPSVGAAPAPKNMPASIKPMQGVTNEDRIHAMAMVLGSVGQNNFSTVLNAAQAGLMQKEQNAREYNDKLTALAQPQYAIKDGRLSYVPAQFEVDKDGNYVPRSESAIEADIQKHLKDNPSLDHPGGASGWREADYIADYQGMTEEQQIAFAETMGVKGRPLTEFELKTVWNKNSAGLAGAIQAAKTGADINTTAETEDFITLRDNVEYIEDDLRQIDEQIQRVKDNPDRGGIFQPIEQFANRVREEFGSKEGALKATNEEIMGSMAIQNMMAWFKEQGLGARGLDTPAEFRAWLRATGGDLSMTNETALYFLEKRRNEMLRNVDRYNRALTDPKYRNVDRIDEYQPITGIRERYESNTSTPPPPPGAVIDGQP